ncbi:phospholipid-transporting ATPase ABCA1-like [Glandiceps talaboti]
MGFFTQLLLLTWKNFTLRKRHKLKQILELVWPLFIFLILVWVRRRRPPENMHECHFNGKAMPSAGLLPFFQSLMCYSQNYCHRYPVQSETPGMVDSFNGSGLSDFYGTLQTIVTNQTLMMDLVSLWNMTQPLPDNFPLGSIISNPDAVSQIRLTPDVMDAINNANLSPQQIQDTFGDGDWRSQLCDNTDTLRNLLSIEDDALLQETQNELCNLNTLDMLMLLMRLQSMNNEDTVQQILSAINGEGDWTDSVSSLTEGLPLADLLTDTDAVRQFLEQNISLSENITDLLLNSPLTPTQLQLLLEQDNLREIVCNTTALGQYLDSDDPATLEELSDQLCQLSDRQLQELADELEGHLRNQWNTTNFEDFFREFQKRLEQINTEFQLLEKLSGGLQEFAANQTIEDIFLGVCGNQSDSMEMSMMYGILGGLRGLDIRNITRDYDHSKDNDMPEEYDKYEEMENEDDDHVYIYDNSTTPFCNSLFKNMESSQFTRILWRRLKPLLVGYVPFSPNTTASRRIIEKANWPFQTLQDIVDLANMWLEISPDIVEYLNTTEIPTIPPELLESMANYSGYDDFIQVYNETLSDKDTWFEAIEVLDEVATLASDFLQCINLDRFVGYDTEEDVLYHGMELMKDNKFWAGVVFTNLDPNPESDVIPNHVYYKIRMDSWVIETTWRLEDSYWTPGPRGDYTVDLKYLQSGFVYLQDMIEHAIVEIITKTNKLNIGMYVQQFPYPCFKSDRFVFFLSFVLPMFMVVSWVYSVAMTIKNIVYEKEQRLKEVMKVMGLGNGVHWVAWFINSFIMMFASSILLILLIKYGKLLTYSDMSVILFFMVSFSISTMMLCFLISTFFSRANLAAACGGIIFLATYVPYVMVTAWEEEMTQTHKILASLIHTISFGYGCTYFAIYEIQGIGLQWDNIDSSPIMGDNFSFKLSLVMMWVDAVIYAVLTWYIEAVFPGQFGMPRPWYFPVTKSYWCGSSSRGEMSLDNPTYEMGNVAGNSDHEQDAERQHFETEPKHLTMGVSIRNLMKKYKSSDKIAVDGLSLNFYEDQITSFLGHNGAGKTTTMSILTGLFPPTSGTAYVYDHDIQTDIDEVRKSMGMCPQHNVLFDHLTVGEHLWFYARLKGLTNRQVKEEMEQMIRDIGLPHKRNEKSKHLSGGMKRKLSVAIAFVGGSRVVILDEPTAGVDPYARRSIWDLLSRYRKGRTIILTTHHMDEADILGDRIAIISQGKLKCCGSSLYLKSQFGNGYYLVLVKKSKKLSWNEQAKEDGLDNVDEGLGSELSSRCDSMSTTPLTGSSSRSTESSNTGVRIYCDERTVTQFVQSQIPGAELAETTTTELTYLLPTEATKSGAFERLFNGLDQNMQKLNISSYGISDTSLEEIFLKVADDFEEPLNKQKQAVNDTGRLPRPFMGLRSLRRKRLEKQQQKHKDKTQLLSDTDHHRQATQISQTPADHIACVPAASFSNVDIAESDTDTDTACTAKPCHDHDTVSLPSMSSVSSSSSMSPLATPPPPSQENDAAAEQSQTLLKDTSLKAKFRKAMATASSPFTSSVSSPTVELVKYNKNSASSVATTDGQVELPTSPTIEEDRQDMDSDTESAYEGSLTSDLYDLGQSKITGSRRYLRQFQALIIKRFNNSRRNVKSFIAQVLVPVVFILLTLLFSLLVPPMREAPSVQLMPWLYPGRQLHMFSSQDTPDNALSQSLDQNLHYTPGIGTRCMTPQPVIEDLPCMESEATKWIKPEMSQAVQQVYSQYNLTDDNPSPPCDCSSGSQQCPLGAGGPAPIYRVTQTTEVMLNMTNRNVTDYLVKTTDDYTGVRYGGLSYLELNSLAPDPSTLMNTYNNISQNLDQNLTQRMNVTDIPQIDQSTLQKIYSTVLNMVTLDNTKVWWNNKGYHALPSYMNVMNNMLLRANIPADEKPEEYGITGYNHPMNRTESQMGSILYWYSVVDLGIATFTVFALAFVPSSFVVYLIQDRSSSSKHLQFVSGLNSTIYWITHLFWDLCNYCITATLIILIFIAFQKEAYVSENNLPCLIALLLLYGWAITPLMYPATYLFSVPSTAYVTLACFNVIVGMISTTATFILDYMNEEDLYRINEILKKVFLLLPHYCLGRGMLDMATNQLYADAFANFGEDMYRNPFAWDICGKNLFFLGIEGAVFFAVVLFIQYAAFVNIRCGKPNIGNNLKADIEEDEDVYHEKQRIQQGDGSSDLLRLESLTKVYRTHTGKKNVAVDKLCIGIPAGQCFGLLGVNGAGKTTTFKMLTGEIRPSTGTAYLSHYSILNQMKHVHQNMGYCPQFDALDNLITGREHLEYYARLRGIPEKDIKMVAEFGIRKLGLVKYADTKAGEYSGGNKRKLSTAISLIGNPPVVFLDEPTTGMDPKAKRFLWKCITNVLKEGRSVILTSHSMEECEALCSRLAIMVNGRFKCLGSTQHLKNRFGDGYMLTIRIGRNTNTDTVDLQSVIQFVKTTFPYAVLKEKHHSMVEYQLPSDKTSLAQLFGAMEANKNRLLIEDYSVSQTTLDQVFINFAKMQKDLDDDLNIDEEDGDDTRDNQELHSISNVVIDHASVIPSVKYSTDEEVHGHSSGSGAAQPQDSISPTFSSQSEVKNKTATGEKAEDYSSIC